VFYPANGHFGLFIVVRFEIDSKTVGCDEVVDGKNIALMYSLVLIGNIVRLSREYSEFDRKYLKRCIETH
jgi:hypothetical protein